MVFDNVLYDIVLIIWIHFIGDFILQTNRMAVSKSEDNVALTEHVAVYSLIFMFLNVKFAVVNMVLHFMVDYVTSRVSKHFWQKNERHWFFVTIGFDQALHLTTLIATYALLIK